MTTPVCVRQRIRQLDRQGLSHREISRKLGVSRTTVVKYANHGDYSPKPLGSGHAGRSLVDAGYSAVVDGWPAADPRMPVKHAIPRPACTRDSWPSAGSRARIRRCSAGSSAGGRNIEPGRTVSPSWSGYREARRSISARPGPQSLAWNGSCISWRCRSRIRTCVGWRHCRAGPRNACARGCWRYSIGRA